MAKANGFVFVHGAWHDHHTWDSVIPLLAAAGIVAKAIDLPGAGVHAARPVSFGTRPLDTAAFGTEPSPNAGVTQDERTAAVIAAVREVNAATGGKAIIVGHSLGGLTVSPVVEAIPDEISAAVYLTAFMLAPGMVGVQIIMHELMARAVVPSLFMADPAKVGALRIDVGSEDPEYVARMKKAFFADLTEDQFEEARRHLHPDEPAQVAGVPSAVTKGKFGKVARHYIECLQDNAITIEGQREMIRLMDEAMGNSTIVHSLNSSHSPFHSMPGSLVQILRSIGG
jgi:pimeloyl-ACP methyl ester carboxylesterase